MEIAFSANLEPEIMKTFPTSGPTMRDPRVVTISAPPPNKCDLATGL